MFACVHTKSLQSCSTLCDPVDCSPPDSSLCGILQARILEWVARPSSRDLPDPGIELTSLEFLHWQVVSLPLVPSGKPSTCVYWVLNFLRAKLVEPASSHWLPWSSQGFAIQLPNDSEVLGMMLIKQNHMSIIKRASAKIPSLSRKHHLFRVAKWQGQFSSLTMRWHMYYAHLCVCLCAEINVPKYSPTSAHL